MAYTDKEALKAYLGISATSDDDLLDALILRAEAIIETQTGRTFASGADATRYYGDGDFVGNTLYVDEDLCAITTITNGDGVEVTAYKTVPRNRTPYHAIVLDEGLWVEGDAEIEVTGRWAFSQQVPATIAHVAIRLAAWLYRQKDNHADLDRAVVVNDMTILPTKLPADVLRLLYPYRRLVP